MIDFKVFLINFGKVFLSTLIQKPGRVYLPIDSRSGRREGERERERESEREREWEGGGMRERERVGGE